MDLEMLDWVGIVSAVSFPFSLPLPLSGYSTPLSTILKLPIVPTEV